MNDDLTTDDRLKLLGIKALAAGLNAKLEMLREMTVEITCEADPSGHSTDFVWGEDISPEELWSRTAADRGAAQ